MKRYDVRILRSDGESFSYETDDFGIISVKGADFPEMEISKQPKGFGHGEIITGMRKRGREIEITAALWSLSKSYDANRASVIGFHNANYTFDVMITYLGVTRIAKDCVISAASYPTERYKVNPLLTISYLSPNADLYALNSDITSFTSISPLWHVTRQYEGTGGKLAFGALTKTTEKTVNYLGSEPAPIVVTVKAAGYVNGIDVAAGDKTMRVATKLYAGDTLVIDGEERLVTKNGVPVPQSDYDTWQLFGINITYGDNTVRVSSGDNTAFTAEISYVGRYGGL